MKRWSKLVCLALILVLLFCACDNTVITNTTNSTNPAPTTPQKPVLADVNRPLPVLPEKKVTDTPAAGDLILAEKGVAKAIIVYPKGNSKAQSAASDLRNYLQRITGAAFTIFTDDQDLPEGNRILVGMTKQTAALGFQPLAGYPKSEEYYIGTKDNCLVLYGNDSGAYRCTQLAVTRFLEEAGCGWYSTEALWQVVPEKTTLAVKPWSQSVKPLFESRMMGSIPGSLDSRWGLGGDTQQIGHALNWLVGKSQLSTHPEWYPEIDGVRPVTAGWWQFCYTNKGLAEYVAQRIIAQFDRNPYQCNLSIASNDGWSEGWCECATCTAAGNPTDQMLVFANNVAEIVSKKHPDKTLSILAYHSTFLPPEKTVAHPNVEVMFCMETNPFTDPSLDYVVHEGYNGLTQIAYSQSWQDSCNEYIENANLQHKAIWTWFCISSANSSWYGAPWVQGNTVTNTFNLYRQMGVTRVFADCSGEMTDLRWPLFYTYARCMWDDALDAESVLYDACQKLYGEAADEMFLFYRTLADCTAINVDDGGLTWVPPSIFSAYGLHVKAIRPTVAAAEAKLDLLTAQQKERVDFQLKSWKYADAVK